MYQPWISTHQYLAVQQENTPQKEAQSLPEPAAAVPLCSTADSKPRSPSKLLAEQTKEKQNQEHMAGAQHLS